MKRVSILFLSLALLCMSALPAMADDVSPDKMDAELAAITESVVEKLEVEEDYTEFQSSYNDGLRPGWYLTWSDDSRYLNVTCDDMGVITQVDRWSNDSAGDFFYGFNAAFPDLKTEEARAAAEEWLDRLVAEGESARIDSHDMALEKSGRHLFHGRILMNGLESPVTFDIGIDADGLTSYYRSDSFKGFVGELPSPEPETEQAAAAAALADKVGLDLYYIREGEDEARLRYVPVSGRYVVDAITGEAVDMEALYASVGGSDEYGYETPAEAEWASMTQDAGKGSGRGLTEVELASIAQYEDVLDREALDAAARAFPQLGLDDFTLARCSYSMAGERITARLTYTAEMNPDRLFGYSLAAYEEFINWSGQAIVYKTVTADAETGELTGVDTTYPLWDNRVFDSEDTCDEIAEAFLAASVPALYGETAFHMGSSAYGQSELTYERMHEGYRYPANYLRVEINQATGAVDRFSIAWDEDVTFAGADVISLDEALEAYIAAKTVTLGYAAWPESLDYSEPLTPLYDAYIQWGYTWVESLRLGWYYDSDSVTGVDALTGEVTRGYAAGEIGYDDLDGVPEEDSIRALGEAGIGFFGGSFRPDAELSLRDAVTLLMQAAGFDYVSGWSEETIRQEAQWQGFVGRGDWEPDREVTRMEFIRMMLGASRYGAAAALEGVWAGDFSGIAPEDAGFTAIARALGMPAGEGDSLYGTCTRADAAALLYGFMARDAA